MQEETAREELKKEITKIIIYFNPWLEKNPRWVEKRETDLNDILNRYDIKRKVFG